MLQGVEGEMLLLVTCCLVYAVHVAQLLASNVLVEKCF